MDVLCTTAIRLSWWLTQQRMYLQCRRPGFNPRVGKIPWRRAWQPTPVFLPGESPWTEEPGGLQPMGSQRVAQSMRLFFVSPSLLPKCSFYRISCGLWYMNIFRERRKQKSQTETMMYFLCVALSIPASPASPSTSSTSAT